MMTFPAEWKNKNVPNHQPYLYIYVCVRLDISLIWRKTTPEKPRIYIQSEDPTAGNYGNWGKTLGKTRSKRTADEEDTTFRKENHQKSSTRGA